MSKMKETESTRKNIYDIQENGTKETHWETVQNETKYETWQNTHRFEENLQHERT